MMSLREFIDAFTRCTPRGWLDWGEGLLLADFAGRTKGPLVEVGSYYGRSAMLLAQLPAEDGLRKRRLYCVDPWDDEFDSDARGNDIYDAFCANLATIPQSRVSPVRCRVEDWEPVATEFVYLDGDHSFEGTRRQIQKAQECRPKIIAVHDVNDAGQGAEVKRAAVELLGPWTERIDRLAVWVLSA
jgi:hypothetical protein